MVHHSLPSRRVPRAGPLLAPWWLSGRLEVSLPWLSSFASVLVSLFLMSRAGDLRKLATQFVAWAEFVEKPSTAT